MRNIPFRYLREAKEPEWYQEYKESLQDQAAELGDILEESLKPQFSYVYVQTSVYRYGSPESLNDGPLVTFKVDFSADTVSKQEGEKLITNALENLLKASERIRSSRTEHIKGGGEDSYRFTGTVEILADFDTDQWYEWAAED